MIDQHPYVQEQLTLTAQKRAEMNATETTVEEDKVKSHFAFGLASGIMPDLGPTSEKETFIVDVRYEVKVIAGRGDDALRVKEGECNHDIYVLYDTDPAWPVPRPVGWMWGARLRREKPDEEGYHSMQSQNLIAFESLVKLLRKHKLLGRAS